MSMMEMDQALRQLRLSGVRATLETRIIEAQVSNLSFLETFAAILQTSSISAARTITSKKLPVVL